MTLTDFYKIAGIYLDTDTLAASGPEHTFVSHDKKLKPTDKRQVPEKTKVRTELGINY